MIERFRKITAKELEELKQKARHADPRGYLEANGFNLRNEGRHVSVRMDGEEKYRLTQKEDGRWVWCDKYGSKGGDTIALAQEISGADFKEAVKIMAQEKQSVQRDAVPRFAHAQERESINMPRQSEKDRRLGREYLEARGITRETIQHAEKTGAIRYCSGGVIFCGRDSDGEVRNATFRAITKTDDLQKRDLKGSDKTFPMVLEGNPKSLWIVEGGVDALAVRDVAKRTGKEAPTVIATGGVNVRKFLENKDIQTKLQNAEKITIVRENEKDRETQAKTDAAHEKLKQEVRQIAGKDPNTYTPPQNCKDMADVALEQRLAEMQREHTRERERSFAR